MSYSSVVSADSDKKNVTQGLGYFSSISLSVDSRRTSSGDIKMLYNEVVPLDLGGLELQLQKWFNNKNSNNNRNILYIYSTILKKQKVAFQTDRRKTRNGIKQKNKRQKS